MRLTLVLSVLLAGCASAAQGSEPRARFIVFGDTGTGAPTQYAVGRAMAQVCEARGCDFALMLGDNFYPSGVTSATDPQFEAKFEKPYAPLKLPVYVVLGNHDTGTNGSGGENWRGQFQVAYSHRTDRSSDRWHMPARYYSFTWGSPESPLAEFFALDSSPLAPYERDADPAFAPETYGATQLGWLRDGMARSKARWKIAFAHHPVYSNGHIGNAGQYQTPPDRKTPLVQGKYWQEFAKAGICGTGTDLYFSGHDHDLEWLKPVPECGNTQFIVSGAAAAPARLRSSSVPAFFSRGRVVGFFWIDIQADWFTATAFVLSGPPFDNAQLPLDARGEPAAAFEKIVRRERQAPVTPSFGAVPAQTAR